MLCAYLFTKRRREAGSLKEELVGQGKKKPNPSSFSAKVERLLAADASCATRLPAQSYETLLVVKNIIITAPRVTKLFIDDFYIIDFRTICSQSKSNFKSICCISEILLTLIVMN